MGEGGLGIWAAFLGGWDSPSPSPLKRPSRNSALGERDTPPIPLLRLPRGTRDRLFGYAQGERNNPPPGDGFRLGGRNDGYAKVSSRERGLMDKIEGGIDVETEYCRGA